MKWTEEVDKRIEWINKRTPLTDLQVGYIEFQMFELLRLYEKVVKNNVGLGGVVKAKRTCAKCNSNDVIMFTADLDICNSCGCTQDGA